MANLVNKLLFLAFGVLCLCLMLSCSGNDDNLRDGPILAFDKPIVLCCENEDGMAELLLAGSDGSYIVMSRDPESVWLRVYYRLMPDNPHCDIVALVDSQGYPRIINYRDNYILLGNIDNSTFDMAVIEGSNISYVWDVKNPGLDFSEIKSGSRGNSFEKWWNSVYYGTKGFTWDTHSKNQTIAYSLKLGVFLIQAASTVSNPMNLLSTVSMAIEEGEKSGLWKIDQPQWFQDFGDALSFMQAEWTDSSWAVRLPNQLDVKQSLAISVVTKTGIMMAEYLSEQYQMNTNEVAMVFNAEAYQLKPTPAYLHCPIDGGEFKAVVESYTQWDVRGGNSWCTAYRSGTDLIVTVKPNLDGEIRRCKFIIYPTSQNDDVWVANTEFIVSQEAIGFDVDRRTINTDYKGGTYKVKIARSMSITSWDVSSYPTWCKTSVDMDGNTLIINIGENKTYEDRDDNITVEGYYNGGYVSRQIKILQRSCLEWDNTKWIFSGEIVPNNAEYEKISLSFDLSIGNVSSGEFNSLALSENFDVLNMTQRNDGSLYITGKYYKELSDGTDKESFTVTLRLSIYRNTATSATADMTCDMVSEFVWVDFYGKWCHDEEHVTYTGELKGTLYPDD